MGRNPRITLNDKIKCPKCGAALRELRWAIFVKMWDYVTHVDRQGQHLNRTCRRCETPWLVFGHATPEKVIDKLRFTCRNTGKVFEVVSEKERA